MNRYELRHAARQRAGRVLDRLDALLASDNDRVSLGAAKLLAEIATAPVDELAEVKDATFDEVAFQYRVSKRLKEDERFHRRPGPGNTPDYIREIIKQTARCRIDDELQEMSEQVDRDLDELVETGSVSPE